MDSKHTNLSAEMLGGFDPEDHDLLTRDGFDHCIVGVVERFGQPPIVCYDYNKVINALIADGMDHHDAKEFFEFNQLGAPMGDLAPCFLHPSETQNP